MSADAKSFRSDAVYVRWATRVGLGYVPREDDETFDSMVDRILFDWLKLNYPEILDHLEQSTKADKDFRSTIIRKTNEQTAKVPGANPQG